MASFEILLISVRSDTPTSFFLVVSKTARLIGPLSRPLEAVLELGASFFRPARLVTACSKSACLFEAFCAVDWKLAGSKRGRLCGAGEILPLWPKDGSRLVAELRQPH